jgi:hypothetical protein
MAVTRDFSQLNAYRPKDATFGEVVAISLYVSLHNPGNLESVAWESVGYTKRKSIHVPPSSNAYWNAMALFAEINRYIPGEDAASRGIRRELKECVCKVVKLVHERELVATYDASCHLKSFQYYEVFLTASHLGWHVDVRVDVDSDGDEFGFPSSATIFQFQCEFPFC